MQPLSDLVTRSAIIRDFPRAKDKLVVRRFSGSSLRIRFFSFDFSLQRMYRRKMFGKDAFTDAQSGTHSRVRMTKEGTVVQMSATCFVSAVASGLILARISRDATSGASNSEKKFIFPTISSA